MTEANEPTRWDDAVELEDVFDELYELELEDDVLISKKVREAYKAAHPPEMDRRAYLKELLRLQLELIKLQDWVEATGERVCVLFEGRDSAGKGGVIKRITQRLNPRICRVVAWPSQLNVSAPNGISSDTSIICPLAVKSFYLTGPGTTAPALSV